jgi:hypothetical protein
MMLVEAVMVTFVFWVPRECLAALGRSPADPGLEVLRNEATGRILYVVRIGRIVRRARGWNDLLVRVLRWGPTASECLVDCMSVRPGEEYPPDQVTQAEEMLQLPRD